MAEDIRDKSYIGHKDVLALNFIKPDGPYVFRRHFRQGLRSHIMEVLRPEDIEVEKRGTEVGGTRWYPRARPRHMLRIFRSRLGSVEDALGEIRRVRLVERYLQPDFVARSTELILDYKAPQGRDIILCGLQEYVHGEILDPWSPLPQSDLLPAIYGKLQSSNSRATGQRPGWVAAAQHSIARFVRCVKRMIADTGHIPDLAGIGNLMITPSGDIKLVDINNICKLYVDGTIHLDDRDYPVCDKSIEVLALLENKFAGRPLDPAETIYSTFLQPQRMEQVHEKELAYHRKNLQE